MAETIRAGGIRPEYTVSETGTMLTLRLGDMPLFATDAGEDAGARGRIKERLLLAARHHADMLREEREEMAALRLRRIDRALSIAERRRACKREYRRELGFASRGL